MIDYLIRGGLTIMVPLLLFNIVAIAVIVDRAYAFWKHRQTDTRALAGQGDRAARAGTGGGRSPALCLHPRPPVSAVLLAGIQSYVKHKPLTDRPEGDHLRRWTRR